jgi:ribosomal protein L7/L12
MPSNDRRKLADTAVACLGRGMSLEEVLHTLRGQGASQVDCIKVLRDVKHLSLAEAKRTVDESPTWADRLEANRRLREQARGALEGDSNGRWL